MALEDVIREAVARGLTDLQLHPEFSNDRKTTYWRSSATPSTQHKVVSVSHLDPIEALTAVLQAMPKAPKRKRSDTPEMLTMTNGSELERSFTAAVKPRFDSVSPPLSEMAQRGLDPVPHTAPDPEPSNGGAPRGIDPNTFRTTGTPKYEPDDQNDEWSKFR